MFEFFESDRNGAIPITSVSKAELPEWLDQHPQSRDWINGIGFKGEPGSFAFLPGGDGRPTAVLAAPSEGAPVYAFAGSADGAARRQVRARFGARGFGDRRRARLGARLLCVHDLQEAEACARDAGLARRRRSRRGRTRCAERISRARPDQHAGRRHGPRASRGRRSELWPARTARRCASSSATTCCSRTIRRSTSSAGASHRAPRLDRPRWGDEAAPKVTLVGKGVCFDTGGLDLKPRDGMLEMKKDMGGAAVMLGLAAGAHGGGVADPAAPADPGGRELRGRQRLPPARHRAHAQRQDRRNRQHRRRGPPDPVRRAGRGRQREARALDRLRHADRRRARSRSAPSCRRCSATTTRVASGC